MFPMVTKFGLVTVLLRMLQRIEESKGALCRFFLEQSEAVL